MGVIPLEHGEALQDLLAVLDRVVGVNAAELQVGQPDQFKGLLLACLGAHLQPSKDSCFGVF